MKNISVYQKCKSGYRFARLTRQEGRIAIVTNARWDAVDAKAATDERGFGVRQKRVVPTPRCWRQVIALDPPGSMRMATVAKEPFTGEITQIGRAHV